MEKINKCIFFGISILIITSVSFQPIISAIHIENNPQYLNLVDKNSALIAAYEKLKELKKNDFKILYYY